MSGGIPFVKDMDVAYGRVYQVSPLIRRVTAQNPGPFTFYGTNTYIIGQDRVAIIDPGPALDEHIEAVMAAIKGEVVSHILVTHTHRDHSPAAAALKARTRAATYGFGPHGSRRAGPQVEEGADYDFAPDHQVRDGEVIAGQGWSLTAVHTPGHTSNHVCYALAEEAALISGDHVMGWSTSIVSPPDGDMHAYMGSLNKLLGRDDELFWPAHGPAIRDPKPFVRSFIAHRQDRERQILACLEDGIEEIPTMVTRMYADVPAGLHPAAARSVLAHLVHMVETGRAACEGDPLRASRFQAVPGN